MFLFLCKAQAVCIRRTKESKLVEMVFKKLAQIHGMDVPIKRSNNALINDMEIAYKTIYENMTQFNDMIDKFGFEIFKTNDIKVELDFMKELMISCESPIMFTHLDYRSSNLMIINNNNNNEEEIIICDYDMARYDYRGRDFAAILSEWGRSQWAWIKSIDNFPPEDSAIIPLVEIYIKECEQIFGKKFTQNPINSLEHIINEIKVFLLNIFLFYAIISCAKSLDVNNNLVHDKQVSLVCIH